MVPKGVDLVGEAFSKSDPQDGINPLKVEGQHRGNVPGIVPHWEEEIKRRKQEILDWNDRSLLSKATGFLGKFKNVPEGVCGEDIARFHPVAPAQKLVEQLKSNPEDYETRIELIDIVGKAQKNLTIEGCRLLLIHTAVAHSFGKFSMRGLLVAGQIQQIYLEQLQAKCRHDLRIIELRTEEGPQKGDVYEQQADQLDEMKYCMEQNIRLIQAYQGHAVKGKESIKYQFSGILMLHEVGETPEDSIKKEEDFKHESFSRVSAAVHYLRYQVLFLKHAHDFADALIHIDSTHPLGYFLKGRIHLSELIFRTAQYGAGGQSEDGKKSVQQIFKQTYHHYSQAVKMTGGHYQKNSKELTMLIEYVQTLRYFILTVSKVLQLKLPKAWVVDNLLRASLLLKQAGDEEPRIDELVKQIEMDLKVWS